MKFEDKLKDAYNQEISAPNNYQAIEESVVLTKKRKPLSKRFKISLIATASALAGLTAVVTISLVTYNLLPKEEKARSLRTARFSLYDTNLIENETFKALNHIDYPNNNVFDKVDVDFVTNVNAFAANSFNKMPSTDNLAYSPLMLYSHLDLISLAASDNETIAQFDHALLTSDTSLRADNIALAMKNNYFANDLEKSTVQAKQAVFIEYKLGANQTFVNELTRRRAEAYELDFHKSDDVNNIITWISQSVNEQNFISKDDLELEPDSALLFISSLYFDCTWSHTFKTTDTKADNFYLNSGEVVRTPFMNHVYSGAVQEFDDYFTFKDYYNAPYYVQYFAPKNENDNILDILPADFLNKSAEPQNGIISLSLPKFKFTAKTDLSKTVQQLGITNPYIKKSNHLRNAFKDPEEMVYSYLTYSKQKTSVAFSEDGTTIKSVVMSHGNGGKESYNHHTNGFDIKLNQPFVYCIRDSVNDLPLLLGTLTNPLAQ